MRSGVSNTLRFALRHGSLRGGTWRVWTSKHGDIYVAIRDVAGEVKASLHKSGDWRYAYTKSTIERGRKHSDPIVDARTRHIVRWSRPREYAPGYLHALDLVSPAVSVSVPITEESADITYVDAPSGSEMTVLSLVLSPPEPLRGYPEPETGPSVLVASLPVAGLDKMLWVVAKDYGLDESLTESAAELYLEHRDHFSQRIRVHRSALCFQGSIGCPVGASLDS